MQKYENDPVPGAEVTTGTDVEGEVCRSIRERLQQTLGTKSEFSVLKEVTGRILQLILKFPLDSSLMKRHATHVEVSLPYINSTTSLY